MAETAETVPHCTLRDGRALAYREYGVSEGFPVFFFHGNLNSRLFEPAWEKTQAQTEAAGARLIAVDRPGYGFSDFLPGRTYASWAQDVRELAQHLGVPAYAVLGFSSGGPNAMVCAAAACGGVAEAAAGSAEEDGAAPRLAACGLLSPDGPYANMGASGEAHLQGMGIELPVTTESVEPVIARSLGQLTEAYPGMSKEERRTVALADLAEATRQGTGAAVQDGVLEGTEWGFSVASIRTAEVPTLLWHGEADPDVPVAAGRWVCEAIEGCRGTFIEGENHTLLRRHWQSILEQVISAARGEDGAPAPQ